MSTTPRHWASRWRKLLLALVLLGLTRHCQSLPIATGKSTEQSSGSTSSSSSSSSSSSTPARKSQLLNSPSELAWQAWLLVDAQSDAQSSLDSPGLLRRITPKSIFIAPFLPACSEGYVADNMGRCMKVINLDKEAHFNFLAHRLSEHYNKFHLRTEASGGSSSGTQKKQPTGPFQLNIPLISSSNTQSEKIDNEESKDSANTPASPEVAKVDAEPGSKAAPQEPILAVLEIKNDTLRDDEATAVLQDGNNGESLEASDAEVWKKHEEAVPVAEFVEESNDSSFSEILDYRIPIDAKLVLNVTGARLANEEENENSSSNDTRSSNITDASPTFVLLLSSTKVPNTGAQLEDEDLRVDENATAEHAIVQTPASFANSTLKEPVNGSISDTLVPPFKDALTDDTVLLEVKNDTSEDLTTTENSRIPNVQGGEPVYDDEEDPEEGEYVDATELPEDESGEQEGGEILRHGEAGITIPVKNVERIYLDKHHWQQEEGHGNESQAGGRINATETPTDEILVRFNNSTPISATTETEEFGSNVSSEVSINGDFIVETTLLDVNTAKTLNTTVSVNVNTTGGANGTEDVTISMKTEEPRTGEALEETSEANPEQDTRSELPSEVQKESPLETTSEKKVHSESEIERKPQAEVQSEKGHDSEPEVVLSPQAVHGTIASALHGRKRGDQSRPKIRPTENPRRAGELRVPGSSTSPRPVGFDQEGGRRRQYDALPEVRAIDEHFPFDRERQTPKQSVSPDGYTVYRNYMRRPQIPVRLPPEEVNSIHNKDHKDERLQLQFEDGLHSSTSTKSSVLAHQKPAYWWLQSSSWRMDPPPQAEPTAASHQRQKHNPMRTLVRVWTRLPLVKDPGLYPSNGGQSARIESHDGGLHPNNRFLSQQRVSLYK